MLQKRDTAIILRSVPYEERHRVVTALTEQHGRISALARNAIQSRRFGGALEPFVASDWMFVERTGANLYRVEEATVRRGFEGLRRDFERLALASVLNELMLRVAPEREPCAELFKLHSNALALVEELPDFEIASLPLLNGYLAKILQWSGNQPQLSGCLLCQSPLATQEPQAHLSCLVSDAGWVCQSCRGSETRHVRSREGQSFQQSLLRVTPAALTDFQASLGRPLRSSLEGQVASRREHEALFRFLEALLIYHLPGFDRSAMKSLRFLGLESSGPPAAAPPR